MLDGNAKLAPPGTISVAEALARPVQNLPSNRQLARRGDGLGMSRVTVREAQILELLSLGLQDKEISLQLGISRGTLRTHMSRLFQKASQNRRAGLVAVYVRMTSRHSQQISKSKPSKIDPG
jgi:DNA-binding NarL/FixJ family response regulator